jgi:transcriptional regulator with XRE-family HTH domain
VRELAYQGGKASMAFKDNLKQLREAAGLSQSQLAERAGISVRTIQNWEIGRNVPKADILMQLAAALDAGLEQLLGAGKRKRGK